MKRYTLLCLILLLIFCSCIKELDLSELRPNPRIVLNSFIAPGLPLKVSVTRTWFIQEIGPDKEIRDADVSLFINGKFKEKLIRQVPQKPTENAFYLSESIAKTGDVVRFEVSAPGFLPVNSEETIPEAIKIQSIRTEKYQKQQNGYLSDHIRFHITFHDNPSSFNYYGIIIKYIIEYKTAEGNWLLTGYGNRGTIDYSENIIFSKKDNALDEIFGSSNNPYTRWWIFNDELINGKEYTIKAIMPFDKDYQYNSDTDQYEEVNVRYRTSINLIALSPSYYLYKKSVEALEETGIIKDLADLGLSEPFTIYTNVNGGTGVVASYQITTDSVTLFTKDQFLP